MKVQTDLRSGLTLEGAWESTQSALASAGHAVGSAGQGIAKAAQGVLNDPGVRETTGKLMWWPFGPPRL